jgi:hypothetical protein
METTYGVVGIIINPYNILVIGRLGIYEIIMCGLD